MTRVILLLGGFGAAMLLVGVQLGSQQRELSCVRDVVTWQLVCK